MKKYVITYDIGTTGIKTCLIEIEDSMRILASATAGYNLYVDDETGVKGGAEQDVDALRCRVLYLLTRMAIASGVL